MLSRFPAIEPYEHGLLDLGDGQQIYWEVCGNPNGRPAVVLHGGPGSGCTAGMRRMFDPAAYRIVLFDQRGAGRSLPPVDHKTDLATNTTEHLISDLERLRTHLAIERWLVWGFSWGTTLALAYAQRHPHAVSELVLASVTLTRPADVHWLYHECGRFFPEQWARFRGGVPELERDGDLVAVYYRLLNEQPDSALRFAAAQRWCEWEDAAQSLEADWTPNARYADAASGSPSRASSLTTSIITPGSHLTSSFEARTGSLAHRAFSCTAVWTSVLPPTLPGSSRRHGPTPSCTSSKPATAAAPR